MSDVINPNETYFSIAAIVDQACIDLQLPGDKYFNRFLSWALWRYADLKLDNDAQIKTELLTISDVNTVRLPADMIDWTKIGIPYGQYVKTLSFNEELSAQERTPGNPEFSHSVPPGSLPNGIDVTGYGGGYYFSNYGGRTLFGVSGQLPSRGHYKMVNRGGQKELLLDAGIGSDQIYLEYFGIGINAGGCTVVNPYAADYVRCAIHHEYEKFLRAPYRSEAAITRTGRDLWHAEMKTKGRTSIDKNSLLMITRKYYRLTPHV